MVAVAEFSRDAPPPMGWDSWAEWERDLPAGPPGSPEYERLHPATSTFQPSRGHSLRVGSKGSDLRPTPNFQGGLQVTATELLTGDGLLAPLPDLPLLGQKGYFVEEWSHLLAAFARTGKTELLLQAIRPWLASGHKVLWITEEPKRLWARRLRDRGGSWEGLSFVFGLGVAPDDLLTEATQSGADMILVDTIRSLLRFEDENSNSEVTRRVTPWIAELRNARKTLILVHHTRKGGGGGGEGIAGASSLLGSVDIAIEMTRDPHQSSRRQLRTYSRVLDPQEAIYERQETGEFKMLGHPSGLHAHDVRERVLAALADAGVWLTTAQIATRLSEPRPSQEAVRQALDALSRDGAIFRDPPISAGPTQGKTQRWATSKSAAKHLEVAPPFEIKNSTSNGQSLVPGELEVVSVGDEANGQAPSFDGTPATWSDRTPYRLPEAPNGHVAEPVAVQEWEP